MDHNGAGILLLFQGGVAQVYHMWYPQENFVKLDARRSLLKQFLGPKSHVLQFLANEISIVATRTLYEV